MKVPDSGHVDGHACMHNHMDIGRASLYEYVGRQPGIRIQAAIAGAIGFHKQPRTAAIWMGMLACTAIWTSDGHAHQNTLAISWISASSSNTHFLSRMAYTRVHASRTVGR